MLHHVFYDDQVSRLIHVLYPSHEPELSERSVRLHEALDHIVADVLLPLGNVVQAGKLVVPKADFDDFLDLWIVEQ